ncbi:MAG: recombinase RecJ [Thermoplasmata archaeon]|nr:MAG: recombinase RecJ [Thermoplasmata archaeon]
MINLEKEGMRIEDRAKEIADFIRKRSEFLVVAHSDADGIAGGAIAVKSLQHAGKEFEIEFVKQLDPSTMERLLAKNREVIWFVDLSPDERMKGADIVVTDHHRSPMRSRYTLNPNNFGIDGDKELSGAGATYLVAREIERRNVELSFLAVIGACGDLQDREERKLIGVNRKILEEAVRSGKIKIIKDIQYFGRECKPIFSLLYNADDPIIPGVTRSSRGVKEFLMELGFERSDAWKRWIDLSKEDKRRILSEIAKRLLDKGFGSRYVRRLIGEVYLLEQEEEGSGLHDAREFATLVNSVSRCGKPDLALMICLGSRGRYLEEARKYLDRHRNNLLRSIKLAKGRLERRKIVYFFHAGSSIKDTMIGSVTSIVSKDLSSPTIGFAYDGDDRVKVSARLRSGGIDLSRAIRVAASSVGGIGGGHRNAAGALIPRGKEEEFLDRFEREIEHQSRFDVL